MNHRADDPHRPLRKQYIEIRTKSTSSRRPNKFVQPIYINYSPMEEECQGKLIEGSRNLQQMQQHKNNRHFVFVKYYTACQKQLTEE